MRANRSNPKPLTNDEGEVRELTEEDFARMVPFSGLPKELNRLFSRAKSASSQTQTPSATRKPAA